jgi:predicted transcriptional regulator
MERAGLVEHEKEGLSHRYRPLVSRQEATGSLLSDFLARFFHGSAEQLILGLVDAEQLSRDELAAIEARIAGAKLAGESTAKGVGSPRPGKPRHRRKKP